ncbi:MAG TPA: urea transporter [Vulgatibacter sp.]
MTRRPLSLFDATMPEWGAWVDDKPGLAFADSCLRGVGQVIFLNNPVTGLLILVAHLVASPRLVASAAVGVVASTATAQLLGFDRSRIRAGYYGYNGLLAGAALAVFLVPSWKPTYVCSVILLALSTTILMAALSEILAVFELPSLTLSFNLVTIPFLWSTYALPGIEHGPLLSIHAIGGVIDPTLRMGPETASLAAGSAIVQFVLRGIGQLFLVDGAVSGLLILLGILCSSRVAAIVAVAGSLAGGAVGVALGASGTAIVHGLWGFNAYVTFVALSGVYFVLDARSALLGLAGAVAATIVYAGFSGAFGPWGVPALTLPFCLVTLVLLLLQRSTALFRPTPLGRITTPEDHLRLFRSQR